MTSKKTKELQKKSNEGPIATDEEFDSYPELFLFFYDELVDINHRKLGISPLSSATYNKIKRRSESTPSTCAG